MSDHTIVIVDTGQQFSCRSDETALVALARSGKRGIPIGCRGGGCGVCKVEVTHGEYSVRVMSRTHVTEKDLADRRILACCLFPASDLELRVIGHMRKALDRTD